MKKYKYGIYGKRHQINRIIITTIYFLLAFVIGILFGLSIINVGIFILLLFILLLLGSLSLILIDPLVRLNFKLSKTGDTLQYIASLDEILKEDRIGDDTRSFVMLHRVNTLYLEDLDKAYEILKDIKMPFNRIAFNYYYEIKVCYYINKKDYETALKLLDEWKKKDNRHQKKDNTLRRIIHFNTTKDLNPNLNKEYIIGLKQKWINIINLFNQTRYYYNRLDIIDGADKMVKKYGDEILKIITDNQLSYKRIVNEVKEMEINLDI